MGHPQAILKFSMNTFKAFPFSWSPGQEPRPPQERRSLEDVPAENLSPDERRSSSDSADWQKLQAIALAARELNEKRERWLHPYAQGEKGGVDVELEPPPPTLPTSTPPGLTPEQQKDLKSRTPSRTLTNLYNQRPMWLVLAHEKLDRAVFDAYGWGAAFSEREGLGEEEILGRLLEENLRSRGRDG